MYTVLGYQYRTMMVSALLWNKFDARVISGRLTLPAVNYVIIMWLGHFIKYNNVFGYLFLSC